MDLMFTGLNGLALGSITDLTLNRYVSRQTINIEKMVTYYNNHYFPINGENPLVRLLTAFLNFGIEATPLDYYNQASSLIETLCLPIGIANSINSGYPHTGIFYGKDTMTQLVYSDFISISKILRSDWKELEAVRVMRRDGVEDPMRRPDLIEKGDGAVFVEIDIATLAYMYKSWVDEQMKKPPEQRLNAYNFLGRIVFPNMIWSGVFCTYIHALHRNNLNINPSEFATNLSIIDYSYRLIRQQRELMDKYAGRSSLIPQILDSIHLFDKEVPSNTALDRLPEVKDRITVANAYVSFMVAFPLAMLCLNNTENAPNRETVLNDRNKVVRYLKNQRTSAKIDDNNMKKLYLSDFAEYQNVT